MLFGQEMSIQQTQRLGLKLSPKMLQSVKLMELPVLELREKIDEELEKNPALELIRDRRVVSLNELSRPPSGEDSEARGYFETSSDAGFTRYGGNTASSEAYQSFIEGALTRSETLQEYLLFQLRLQPASAQVRKLSELLIQNLSNDGFHKEDITQLDTQADGGDIQKALELVRRLDPQGCCTADYKESLAVQAHLKFADEACGIIALIPFMEALERGKTITAERALKKNAEDITDLFTKLRALAPFPGRQFVSSETAGQTRFITPEVRVIRADNEFKIMLNNETMPVLGITPFFSRNEDAENPRDRDFIRENLRDARWFINALNRRNHTIYRVCKAIVHFQRQFFEFGPRYLVPLSQKDIAEKIDVHETTVSRAANGKYMETEWGIFEIRRFFTNSISGSGTKGSRYSKEAVKEIIREIITGENHPQSDNDIVSALAERGIPLARRTVAKYRSQLDLGSSYRR